MTNPQGGDKPASVETCPCCERTDDHVHEFVDVLSPECDHELAKLRAEVEALRARVAEQRWIAVADELPDSDVWVLAVGASMGYGYAIVQLEFTDDSEGHGEPYWATGVGELAFCNYPHWMPLRSPPSVPETAATKEGE